MTSPISATDLLAMFRRGPDGAQEAIERLSAVEPSAQFGIAGDLLSLASMAIDQSPGLVERLDNRELSDRRVMKDRTAAMVAARFGGDAEALRFLAHEMHGFSDAAAHLVVVIDFLGALLAARGHDPVESWRLVMLDGEWTEGAT